jgi:membrane-associated phospholipid phosphatase
MLRTLLLALAVACSPAAASAQSFASIFTRLPADFVHLAEPANLIILGSTGLGSVALHPKDDEIARRANDADQVFAAGGVLGDGATHAAAGLTLFIAGRLTHHDTSAQLGVDLLRAQIVSGAITDGLKLATNRTRPDGRDYSFPSGHTSSAFATAAVLQGHFGWKAGVPAYLISTYVASSRLANYRHFATDVLFGAGIGLASGRAVTFQPRGHAITVAPSITLHSIGITGRWVVVGG